MDRARNPFAPGAGLQPPALAGRHQVIENARIDMNRLRSGRPVRSLMMLGLRGVGKTVLLNRLVREAGEAGFNCIKIEVPEGQKFASLLAPQLRHVLHVLDMIQGAKSRMRSAFSALRNFVGTFNIKVGDVEFGFEPAPGIADSGDLEQDLPQLLCKVAEAAAERGQAVCLFLDEVQYLSTVELAALVVSLHEISQRNLPLFMVGAGLPQVATLAGNAKSYAERLLQYPEIGPLSPEAARSAIVEPIEREGATIAGSAVDEIIRITNGYPYFIQEWGAHAWNQAASTQISLQDVLASSERVIPHLDASFFRVRFDRLTALEQKYLRAMAELGPGPYKTGQIAETLGLAANEAAPIRRKLIDKGMVWSQRHGETAFTVPLFDEFMLRQMPELQKHTPKRRL